LRYSAGGVGLSRDKVEILEIIFGLSLFGFRSWPNALQKLQQKELKEALPAGCWPKHCKNKYVQRATIAGLFSIETLRHFSYPHSFKVVRV